MSAPAVELTPDRVVGPSSCSSLAVLAPLIFSTYWVGTLLTQVLILGIVAASLIFLSAYGGMVSLAQVAIYGIAGFALGNLTTNGTRKGLNLGWSPWIGRRRRDRHRDASWRCCSARSRAAASGIYFLMITLDLLA